MKITDLIPKQTFDWSADVGQALAHLYQELEDAQFDNADEIIEMYIDAVAMNPHMIPSIEFALINLSNNRFNTDVLADEFYGYNTSHFTSTMIRQKRSHLPVPKTRPADVKLALQAHVGIPLALTVNLGVILGQGEYPFMQGAVIASEDEIHFPIGIKPHTDTWWFTHDHATGYLVRAAINDMAEARELLTNTLSVEDSTNLEGVAIWLSIMGNITAPDDLGRLYATVTSSYQDPETPDYVKTMPLWNAHTSGSQKANPRIQVRGNAKLTQAVLDSKADTPHEVELPECKFRFEDGMKQRKKIDLRRSMVNRIAEQGIQDSLAIKPLEDALQARFPMWLMMADRKELNTTKASLATSISVAADIGGELSNLKSIVQQQMRIAMDNKAADKQKSAAMARAVQASRAILALRKEAGYFDLNNATKSGIFQNMDSTVLQDDGAQFDKLINQLAGSADE